MALDTYDNLVKEIVNFSHRGDADIHVPTFILMAEQEMYANDQEVLKVRGQESLSSTPTTGRFLPLPEDYQSMRSVRLVTDISNEIRYKAPDKMRVENGTGLPEYFTITSQIEFNRTPDTTYTAEIQYYAIPAALNDDNQTNDILTDFPTVYLFGALKALFQWADDEQQRAKYESLFFSAIRGANKRDKQGRYGPAPAMVPAGTVV